MSVQSIEGLQRYLCRLCDEAVPPDDAVLLARFVATNDREAFELLIARHGPMVLGTARRLVDQTHDAEDVFQAVFLSLARLAKTIRQGRTLPAWLHQATRRIAAKLRKKRRTAPTEASPEPSEIVEPDAQLVWREVRQALDEELQRLPERLRSPLLLCYLSGLSRDEAAKQLGWSVSTLKRRLDEGRQALRVRLDRRGIAAVGLALTVLAPEALQATVSRSLHESTVNLICSSGAVVPAAISAHVLHATYAKGLTLKSMFAVLAAAAVGVGIYAGAGQADPPKPAAIKEAAGKPVEADKVVFEEDPLPAGSVLRFGTSRFRQGPTIVKMAVSPDGKTAYVVGGTSFNSSTRAIDLGTGRTLFNIEHDEGEAVAAAPDGRTVVTKKNLHLYVLNSRTGKVLRTLRMPLPGTNSRSEADALAFTPDGKAVATISDSKDVHLIDVETGKTIRDFVHDNPESTHGFPQVLAIAFSPDGKLMATGGYANVKDDYFARLWDVESGKEIRRFMHGKKGYGVRTLAFSPDGTTLATLGTQSGVFLRLFDVETGKERKAFPKDGNQRTLAGSVAFTPDGKTVATAGESIRLYDVATGGERLRIDRRRASNLHFTDAGKTLTAAIDGAIYRWDTTAGKLLTPDAGDSVIAQVLVSADGRRVVSRGHEGGTNLWDGKTGKHLRRLRTPWQQTLAMSPDGRFLAWPVADPSVKYSKPHEPRSIYEGTRIRLYDIAADKFVDRFPAFQGNAQDLTFTRAGKHLVTVGSHGGTVRTWNVETGKEERSFAAMLVAPKDKVFQVGRTTLSPDGGTVAMTYSEVKGGVERLGRLAEPPHQVRLWDVATGKQLPHLDGGTPVDHGFSPDGRFVVTAVGNSVYETASGRRVAVLPEEPYIRAAAFSRDGRYLATAVHGGLIHIWEVATWTKRNEFKGYDNRSITLAFGPVGRLFCGNQDTTILAWDTGPPPVAETVSLDRAWTDLAAWESNASFRTEGRCQTAPEDAVKLFAAKIHPPAALDARRLQRLLAELGSDEFAVREAASKTLLGLNEQANPHLEATLKNSTSAEVRDRAKRVLDQKRAVGLTTEQVRQIRAVTVLERIADDEATALLKRWAGGPAGALLTLEATAAVGRLEAGR